MINKFYFLIIFWENEQNFKKGVDKSPLNVHNIIWFLKNEHTNRDYT